MTDRVTTTSSAEAFSTRAGSSPASALERFAVEHSAAIRGGAHPELLDRARRLRDAVSASAEAIPAAAAWRLGFAHHVRGEYVEAIAYFAGSKRGAGSAPAADMALVAAGYASSMWAQGDASAGRELADEALDLATTSGDELALAAAWVAQALLFAAEGERTANLSAYESALAHAERAHDALTIVRVHSNMGSMHSEEGRNDAALEEVDAAITVAESTDVGVVGAIAFINRAEALLGLGRLDEAVAEARAAVEIYRTARSPMHVFALLLEAHIYRIRGNATRAQVRYREAIDRARQTGDAQVLTSAFAGLARTYIADDRAAAVQCAQRALEQPNALGNVEAQLCAGWVALAVGEKERALEWSRTAIAESGRRRNVIALADALELGALALWQGPPHAGEPAAMLLEASGIWREAGDPIRIAVNRALIARVAGDRAGEDIAQRALQSLGVRVDVYRIAGPLQAIGQRGLPAISIRTLGGFVVQCEGEALAADAWPSRKSRDLLAILAGRRGRPITREAVGELLWPGVRDSSARLSVALSNARLALDPEHRFEADYFLSSSNSQLRLQLATVRVDAAEFEQLAAVGLQAAEEGSADALATLEAAAALYPAPFLSDEKNADWALEVRDELRELATSVKRALVRLLDHDADAERPIRWLVSLLNDDPFDEGAHHQLIASLARARRFGDARRAYRQYAARMADLEVPAVSIEELVGASLGI
jgi:DNA-binding SARP family transcriptional activator/tetratricopeptide (TPR) repeat protein